MTEHEDFTEDQSQGATGTPGGTVVSLDTLTKDNEEAAGGSGKEVDLPPLHVLVAEDYGLNQKVISVMLGDMGHRISIANNGQEAVSAVLRGHYDVILMDVHMPVMDGKTATRRIRALPRPEGDIPIIALTADASLEQKDECLAAGMDDYLTKPIILPDLLRAMAESLVRADVSKKERAAPGAAPEAVANSDSGLAVKAVPVPIVDSSVLVEFASMVGWDTVANLFDTLAKDFVEHRKIITRAAENHEIEVLRRQTQALNGALGQFGATKAQETAHVIETLCKAGYSDNALDLIPQFLQLGQDSIVELHQFLINMAPSYSATAPSPSLSI
ncbi:MAG: response regulator [Rhodospirillaceae bacterium]|jgi:two-component system, sensor histidine kinase and response regulator|nr:response regulator [Rhodospirillaceae bacterium]MBT4488205.1 response regulator [Rhodospirillaceae bacterium]MBT5190919.1 response regulator [Rhodospirillaceae bacterium]MBT5899034.1 response regulator [Rhodospirillaceae bacterium]MBT6431142.1 response regulator [Rhodospirillaceae bacterium]